MKVVIRFGEKFIRQAKQLKKKYPSLAADLKELEKLLLETPDAGVDLGGGLRKVRISIASKGKGKSGGARVITYTTIISIEAELITLLTIYDKSERSSISDKELRILVAELSEKKE